MKGRKMVGAVAGEPGGNNKKGDRPGLLKHWGCGDSALRKFCFAVKSYLYSVATIIETIFGHDLPYTDQIEPAIERFPTPVRRPPQSPMTNN